MFIPFPESLDDVHILLIDVLKDLTFLPNSYVSYIQYHCTGYHMAYNLTSKLELEKKSHLQMGLSIEISQVNLVLNYSELALPNQDHSYQCKTLYKAYAEDNTVLVNMGEHEVVTFLLQSLVIVIC